MGFKPAPTARHGGAVRCHRVTMALPGPHQGMEMAAAFHGKGQGGSGGTGQSVVTEWPCCVEMAAARQGPGRVSNPGLRHYTMALSVVTESLWPWEGHISGWRWLLHSTARARAGFKPGPTALHDGTVRCHRITMALGGPHQGMEMAAASYGKGQGGFQTRPYGTTRWRCPLSQNHYGLGRATSGDGDGCCVPRQGLGRVSNPRLRHDMEALDVFIE